MLIDESLYVGQKKITTRKTEWHNEGRAAISNTAYCCPACGDIWARRLYHAPDIRWSFYTRACEEHGNGSLFDGQELEYATRDESRAEDRRWGEIAYPIEWLAYELFLILRRIP